MPLLLNQTDSRAREQRQLMVVVQVDAAGTAALKSDAHRSELWIREISRLRQTFVEIGATSIWIDRIRNGTSTPSAQCDPELLWGSRQIVQSMNMGVRRPDLHFAISPTSFFQVNTRAAEQLFSVIRKCALSTDGTPGAKTKPSQSIALLDVCCGSGTIGLSVASSKHCVGVIGVDSCKEAVEDARKNAILNGLERKTRFVAGLAEACIDDLQNEMNSLLRALETHHELPVRVVAVIDPPRTGLAPSVCAALRANPLIARVIVVSCNPTGRRLRQDFVVHGGSFLENALILTGPLTTTTEYRLKRAPSANAASGCPFVPTFAVPVDMFPMTPHCELVMVFNRTVEA